MSLERSEPAMLTLVLVVNFLIGSSCLLVAWQLWRLKCRLARFADQLIVAEKAVHRVLQPAPQYIRMGQTSTHHLRQRLSHLGPQIERIQQIMSLLSLTQIIWQRYFLLPPRSPSTTRDRREPPPRST